MNWITVGKWFGADTVSMNAVPIPDTVGLTYAQKIMLSREEYGERIWLDDSGKIGYSNFVYCPTGSTIRELTQFQLINGQVYVVFNEKLWNRDRPDAEMKVCYKVGKWTSEHILLYKNNPQ